MPCYMPFIADYAEYIKKPIKFKFTKWYMPCYIPFKIKTNYICHFTSPLFARFDHISYYYLGLVSDGRCVLHKHIVKYWECCPNWWHCAKYIGMILMGRRPGYFNDLDMMILGNMSQSFYGEQHFQYCTVYVVMYGRTHMWSETTYINGNVGGK